MATIETKAYAKINLALDVTGVRDDGYHEVRMVMQTLSLHDRIYIMETDNDSITMTTNLPFLPADRSNLAYLAAQFFMEETGIKKGLHISLNKHIPVSAGLAGGSSDAAAVLRGLNVLFNAKVPNEKLMEIAARLGADVPYCLMGGTVLSEGIGEKLTSLFNAPYASCLLIKPSFSVSTKHIYEKLDLNTVKHHPDIDKMIAAITSGSHSAICEASENILEPVTTAEYPEVAEIKKLLLENGADCAVMSGSGPTVFGLYNDKEKAKEAFIKFKAGKYAKYSFMTGYNYNINT